MNDKLRSNEDEYQFSELETTDIYGASANTSAVNRFKQIRRILLVVGIIAAIFAVYKISGFFTGTKKAQRHLAPVQPVMQPINLQPTTTKVTTTTTSNTLPALSNTQSNVAPSKIDQSIAALEQKSSSTREDIEKLSQQVDSLRSTMGDLQTTIQNLTTSLQDISSQLQQQNAMIANQETLLKALQPPPKKLIIIKRRTIHRRIMDYYVEAIIPGRAWLKRSDGATLTVSAGSHIPGYQGVVSAVDPQTGEVILTTGEILTFQADDR